jgi:hypothetical protein
MRITLKVRTEIQGVDELKEKLAKLASLIAATEGILSEINSSEVTITASLANEEIDK